jgi:hypothetical protein
MQPEDLLLCPQQSVAEADGQNTIHFLICISPNTLGTGQYNYGAFILYVKYIGSQGIVQASGVNGLGPEVKGEN